MLPIVLHHSAIFWDAGQEETPPTNDFVSLENKQSQVFECPFLFSTQNINVFLDFFYKEHTGVLTYGTNLLYICGQRKNQIIVCSPL